MAEDINVTISEEAEEINVNVVEESAINVSINEEPVELAISLLETIEEINVSLSDVPVEINVGIKEGDGHGTGASIKNHRDVSNENPSDKDGLIFNEATGRYEPKSIMRFDWDNDYECYT